MTCGFVSNRSELSFVEIYSTPPCRKEIEKTRCVLFCSQCLWQCCSILLFVPTVGRCCFLSFFLFFLLPFFLKPVSVVCHAVDQEHNADILARVPSRR